MTRPPTLLRHLRRSREISLDLLSLRTGVDVSRLSRAERRLIGMSDAQLEKVAKFFKVNKHDLLKDAQSASAA